MNNCVFAVRTAALCAVAAVANGAWAAPLNLLLENDPDIVSSFIDVAYDAESDDFSADGFAFRIDDDGVGPAIDIANGLFTIDATIDAMGKATIGSLTITGLVPSLGFGSGTLLVATLIDFGFPVVGGDSAVLEFLWQITGGDAASLYGGIGAQAGTLLTQQTGFPGTWASDWDNFAKAGPGSGFSVADTAPLVPAPMTAGVFALFAGAAIRRRRSA